jgi:DNA topoisomerase II
LPLHLDVTEMGAKHISKQDHVSAEMQTELERLNNQARFVQMIIDKKLVVSNRKKADIVVELRELQFRPFPKINKAKSAGETEAVVENEVDEDEIAAEIGVPTNADFDYLLGMPIWNLTKEKVYLRSHMEALALINF